MWTIRYKGFFINGYCDKPECSVVFWVGGVMGKFKSLHSAKIGITEYLKCH
jgi:hypothetical protein